MNVTTYVTDFTSQVSQISPSLVPNILWRYYLEYLWNYTDNSWVAKIAYVCRVISIIFSFPFFLLSLLDIVSYGIARTLGVIDDVKASTNDLTNIHKVPTFSIHEPVSPTSETNSEYGLTKESSPVDSTESLEFASQEHTYYAANAEENNLKLSGVGVFSPAASEPPSPTLSRQDLRSEIKITGRDQPDDAHLRSRAH